MISMFRFKLRTLLIAIALAGFFLALQVHVHNQALRFVEIGVRDAVPLPNNRPEDIKLATVASVGFYDILLCRRRCHVWTASIKTGGGEYHHYYRTGHINCFGEWFEDDDSEAIEVLQID